MDNSKKRKTENEKKMKLKAEHKNILMVVGGIVSLGILVALATALARKPAVHAPTVVPTQPPVQCPAPPQCPAPMQCPACPREPQREAQPPQREAEPLEQTFADVASTVMSRAGVDDRINPAISTKNGGMLPILDVRGDYDPLMPYEDARCDENGRWNQSSRQQGIRLGLIRDQMKRRVVVQ